MTAGSWIHSDLSEHMRSCVTCRDTKVDDKRVEKNEYAFHHARNAMCPSGRSIYQAWLAWLRE